MSANGVRVNYYNASRRANSSSPKPSRAAGQRRPAKRRPPRSAPGAVAFNGAASIDDLAARLVANIQALATVVGEQNRELTELRDRVDRARDALRYRTVGRTALLLDFPAVLALLFLKVVAYGVRES